MRDRIDDISYASGYVKHLIGGILRDVHLLALPKNFPDRLFFTTDLDNEYKSALLNIFGELKSPAPDGRIELEMIDIHHENVNLDKPSFMLRNSNSFSIQNKIQNPNLWDAEHPHLYQLTVTFIQQENLMWRKTYQVGFREIEVAADQLRVNGRPVKLRGARRHDIHQLLGRSSSNEYDLKDDLLAKELI